MLVGIPLGAYLIRLVDAHTLRRVYISVDVWIVGFGLARVLGELRLSGGAYGYTPMALAIALDSYLLFTFFSARRSAIASATRRGTSAPS